MSLRSACLATCCLTSLALLGCSGGSGGAQKVYRVTGKITMNGGPVANAAVSFSPLDKQPVAVGRTNASGDYTLTTYVAGDGAAAGKFTVLVYKDGGGGDAPVSGHEAYNSGVFDPGASHAANKKAGGGSTSALPAKYGAADQSDLKAEVKPGGPNKFDFDLKP